MKMVGRFQMLSRLGQGAMADVYRAHDPEIKRDLAIKILNQQYRRDPECVARFLREARAAGSLSHPNIVTIYDVGEVQGFPYIAMELLNGQPLDKAIEVRGAFPIEEAVHIGIQLADSLCYAHELGIVHRDIKPSNIILCQDGRTIKLLDFGIARVTENGGSAASETLKTQVGQVLGTPRYMSPEQAMGQPLDGRSDLFSLGAILYELITGKPAFDGASIATLAVQITTQQPGPISVTPECPRGLRFIIDKLLSKQPEKRFANGAQLVAALNREAATWSAEAKEEKARRLPLHLRFALLASAVVACVLSVGIGWVLDQQYRAMERVAEASGSSIATFVASNTALHAMENDTRPSGEADWLPVQAFVRTASADRNITEMMVVDRNGVVQASADPALVGTRYKPSLNLKPFDRDLDVLLSHVKSPDGAEAFRFVTPILYSGRNVGTVQVGVRKSELQAAAGWTRMLLVGLGALMMALAFGLSFVAGRVVLAPLRRLNAALKEAAQGRLDFRISHRRRDEFGELFDSFNALAGEMEAKLDCAPLERAEAAATMLRGAVAAMEPLAEPEKHQPSPEATQLHSSDRLVERRA
jgi:eukaryotic-like serine/threonine-protein kinase